jgi:ParB family chromosome partitioning protein
MSENSQTQKTQIKGRGLGRGLGSLLGASDDGAFPKTTVTSERVLQKLSETSASQKEPALQQGFVETPLAARGATPVVRDAVVVPLVPEHLRIWHIAIEKLEPNPKQPRQEFDPVPLQELANSIQEKGIIQPILVRKKGPDQFEIIAGERRWRAAQMAGLKEIPAIIKDTHDQEVLELALIENIQRENLNVVEEAEAYDFLIKKYNLTQSDLATKVGKDRATVANVLRILQLQPSVRQKVSRNELSLGQAKVLLSVEDRVMQEALAQRAIKENLSVRALEKLVAKTKVEGVKPVSDDERLRATLAKNVGEELQQRIGSKVNLEYVAGKGKISIQFYSDEELNQIVDHLRDAWPS